MYISQSAQCERFNKYTTFLNEYKNLYLIGHNLWREIAQTLDDYIF